MNPILSIIIPIEVNKSNYFRINRLNNLLSFFQKNEKLEVVVVNSGKEDKYRKQIKDLCEQVTNTQYIFCQMPEIYSAAYARNTGVAKAQGDYVLFFDVDLWVDTFFIDKVLTDIKDFKRVEEYTIYPCYYLDEMFSKEIEQNNQKIDFSTIKLRYLEGYNDQVLYLAVNTSTLLVNRKHFIAIGAYNEKFQGHGYEDFELIHRLYMEYPIVERKDDYLVDYKTNFPAEYRGFRKYFAYNALPNFFEDKCSVHLWHSRPLTKKYYKNRANNAIYFQEIIQKNSNNFLEKKYIDISIPHDYQQYIDNLLSKYGFNKEHYHGLYYLKYDSQKNLVWYKKIFKKIRKFFFDPKKFMLDMKLFKLKNPNE